MDYRTPLQHLLRNLLPSRQPPDARPTEPDFADTRRDFDRPDPAPPRRESRRTAADRTPAVQRRHATGWAESSSDLMQGTEIMEFPDDTAADLMDEYFGDPKKRPT